MQTYYEPLDCVAAAAAVAARWAELSKGAEAGATTVRFGGRAIRVEKAVVQDGGNALAWFSFEELCGARPPRGTADFSAIAAAFHTVFLVNVPKLSQLQRDAARRLISLVDALYDHRVKLIVHAHTPVEDLFAVDRDAGAYSKARASEELGDLLDSGKYVQADSDESFAFDRTVSRLREMGSESYQLCGHLTAAAAAGEDEPADGQAGADFLLSFESQTLAAEHMDELWERYDADRSGSIRRGPIAPEPALLYIVNLYG